LIETLSKDIVIYLNRIVFREKSRKFIAEFNKLPLICHKKAEPQNDAEHGYSIAKNKTGYKCKHAPRGWRLICAKLRIISR
jgi:hypothetical protein